MQNQVENGDCDGGLEGSELNNQVDGVNYHNHRRGEARRKSRRMRSRRQRMRNFGGGLGGAQFNSQIQNNFFGDSKQVLCCALIHWVKYQKKT